MNKISWQSPSNIALVKYWGKKPIQLPTNPSISFTLNNAITETTIHWQPTNNKAKIDFYFEGNPNEAFKERIVKYISEISEYLPGLNKIDLDIDSKNSFPHSSGIASSASAMSAMALCLVSIYQEYSGTELTKKEFFKLASKLSRIGSGSASRSVYGGINLWGKVSGFNDSSDEYTIEITDQCAPIFRNYGDAILLVSNKEKKVSSSVGHNLMINHPYASTKFEESFKNTKLMLDILKTGDQHKFAELVEAEALSLHAMMLTSSPSYILMEANTIALINKIKEFRQTTGIQVCFTLDAGANVHLLYPGEAFDEVKLFITNELLQFCNNKQWIDDKVGSGPKKNYNGISK